jgi:hypothetical protein
MAEVKIQVIRPDLAEMDIEQEPVYVPVRFRDSAFVGYWVGEDYKLITFYVGSDSYICRNIEKNITLFETLLKNGNTNT